MEMFCPKRGQKLILVPGRGGVLGKSSEMHEIVLVPSKPSLILSHETLRLWPRFDLPLVPGPFCTRFTVPLS